jgi:hypothetical protein
LCWGSEDAQRYVCRRKIIDLIRLLTTVVIALTITRLVKLWAIRLAFMLWKHGVFQRPPEIRSKYDRNTIESTIGIRLNEWLPKHKSDVRGCKINRIVSKVSPKKSEHDRFTENVILRFPKYQSTWWLLRNRFPKYQSTWWLLRNVRLKCKSTWWLLRNARLKCKRHILSHSPFQ